jgi:hypothetical protein
VQLTGIGNYHNLFYLYSRLHLPAGKKYDMKPVLLLSVIFLSASCNSFKEKTKSTINKAGEVVAEAGSEFADGVKKGVEKTFTTQAVLSADLTGKGLQTGKIIISSTDSTTDNIVSAYLIFNGDINQPVTLKVFTDAGQEYGRVTQPVKGSKGEARYVDFIFDKRTNIDGKGKLSFE